LEITRLCLVKTSDISQRNAFVASYH
jgi:hypothetical protein